jgi:glutamate-1-semialdehyde 2,1-aminomutase
MNDEKSRELFERLARVMPGANTRTVTHYEPFPVGIARGEGCRLWDVDGNSYIDLINNYTALIHGHAHPRIVEAVTRTAQQGLAAAVPAPIALQAELAERLCSRTPSIDLVRFTNSATEAVMMAVRAARAFTGRDHVIMPANGYHGSWDQVSLSGTDEAHPDGAEGVVPAGIPAVLADIIHFVRFNDIGHLEELMSRHGSETAAIILEPILGHILEAGDPEFMRAALRLAHENGALLILDETITYRLHVGGWQAQHGIEADLTTLGKTIAGGMPLGAFGGKENIMRIFDPRIPEPLAAHGTMNGSPLCLAAGCASLDLLDQPTIDRINGLAGSLSRLLNAAADEAGLDVRVHNCGSLLQVNLAAPLAFHRACLEEGLYIAPRGSMNLSTPMDDAVIGEIVAAWKRALGRMNAADLALASQATV